MNGIEGIELTITTEKGERVEIQLSEWQAKAVTAILGFVLEPKDGYYVLNQFVDEKVKETTLNLDWNTNLNSVMVEKKTL